MNGSNTQNVLQTQLKTAPVINTAEEKNKARVPGPFRVMAQEIVIEAMEWAAGAEAVDAKRPFIRMVSMQLNS